MTRDAGGEAGRPGSPDGGEEASGPRERTAAERFTLAISVMLILGLVALVTYVSVTGGGEPPIVEAIPLLDEIRHEGESYFLPLAVTNRGGQTAAEVTVQAELAAGDGSAETSEFTLDFLAGGETRDGTVVFAADPAAGELTVDVASFQAP
ncbi:MAG TPA: TIGR02588 family protein [Thermomicrobiales bacterium]|nr:TIGR02588 family protein [Thermomicrobiales bacterium]